MVQKGFGKNTLYDRKVFSQNDKTREIRNEVSGLAVLFFQANRTTQPFGSSSTNYLQLGNLISMSVVMSRRLPRPLSIRPSHHQLYYYPLLAVRSCFIENCLTFFLGSIFYNIYEIEIWRLWVFSSYCHFSSLQLTPDIVGF